MLRPLDIAVLLKLTLLKAEELSFQKLASDLHIASSEVHGAVKRARVSGLMRHDGPKRVNRSALLELLGHGMRYVYPPVRGELTRGMPTSFAAEPLRSVIHDSGAEVPVWPYVSGKVRGYSLSRSINTLQKRLWRTLRFTNSSALPTRCGMDESASERPPLRFWVRGYLKMASNLPLLEEAAVKLKHLLAEVVFVGGSTLDLMVTDQGSAPIRST